MSMGVYIKGIEMPVFEHQSWDIRRGADEKWYMVDTNAETSDGEWHEIVPVPPHGRLIDADAMKKVIANAKHMDAHIYDGKTMYSDHLCVGADYDDVCAAIDETHTIIPADGKGYILAPQEEYDGLKRKYVVLKSDSGEPVEDCFVLRPDKDKAAIVALLAYADATDNQVLAKDIRAWISTISAEEGET